MSEMLRVAFYHHSYKTPAEYELHSLLMAKAVNAVRKHMPYAEIWHLRAERTPKFAGVDRDIVYNDLFHRPAHSALMPAGNTVFLDVDCVVQRDLFEVFRDSFDVAVCLRMQYENKPPVALDRPAYNGGVMFTRSQEFWKDFAEYHALEKHPWNDAFIGLYFQERKRFTPKELPSSIYNYIPAKFDEDVSGRAVVHYKGEKRKYWMKHLP